MQEGRGGKKGEVRAVGGGCCRLREQYIRQIIICLYDGWRFVRLVCVCLKHVITRVTFIVFNSFQIL